MNTSSNCYFATIWNQRVRCIWSDLNYLKQGGKPTHIHDYLKDCVHSQLKIMPSFWNRYICFTRLIYWGPNRFHGGLSRHFTELRPPFPKGGYVKNMILEWLVQSVISHICFLANTLSGYEIVLGILIHARNLIFDKILPSLTCWRRYKHKVNAEKVDFRPLNSSSYSYEKYQMFGMQLII